MLKALMLDIVGLSVPLAWALLRGPIMLALLPVAKGSPRRDGWH